MTININSYSDSRKFLFGGEWYPSFANFPGLQILLHSDDVTTGDEVWIDRVAGRSVSLVTGTFTKGADGVDVPAATNIDSMIAPSGVKDHVLLSTGTSATAGATSGVGDDNTYVIQMDINGNVYVAPSAAYCTTAAMAGITTFPFVGCNAVHADMSASNAFTHACNTDGSEQDTAAAAQTSGDIGALGFNTQLPTAIELNSQINSRTHIFALFAFTNPVDDVAIAVAWMAANPTKLYPGWAGKT